MKEFYDRGDCFDEDDNENDEMGEMGGMSMNENQMGLDLVIIEINRKILEMAVDLAKKGWLWRFRGIDSKLKIVESVYKKLSSLIMIVEE